MWKFSENNSHFVPKATAAEIIAILLNVSYPFKMDAEKLIRIFRKDEPVTEQTIPQLDEFFDSCPVEYMRRFMKENGLVMSSMSDIFYALPESRQSLRFKRMMENGSI